MEINTQVWGSPATWVRDEVFNYQDVTPAAYQFKRGQYTTLQAYNEHGLNLIGSDIDSSICYAGMAKGLPLTKMRAFLLDYDGDYTMRTYTMDRETGWYFGDLNSSYTHDNDCLIVGGDLLKNVTPPSSYIKNQYWKPSGNIRTYPEQPSCRIIPIVEFNTKGLYFGVKVRVFKQSDGTTQDVWLDSLRTGNWNGFVIVRAWLETYTMRASQTDFLPIDNSSSHRGSVSPISDYEFSSNGSKSMKFQQYALLYSSIPLYGWITNEATTITIDGVKHYSARSVASLSAENVSAQVFIDTLDSTYNIGDYTSWGMYAEGYAAITAANLERLRQCAASFGLFFTEKNPATFDSNADRWTHEDMFCGLLDNGIGKGAYTQGEGNQDNPVFDMGSSQNSPYVPSAPFDPNIYSNVTGFNSLSSGSTMTKRYVLDAANVEKLGDDLWTICGNIWDQQQSDFEGALKDEFLTTNPIDCIVSLQRYPFNIPHTGSSKSQLRIGKSDVTAEGYATFNPFNTILFQGVDLYPRFGDSFLDYEPYTSYEVYIPFCGTTKLRAADILGHTLNIMLQIDLFTGSCTAYIMADALVIDTLNGSCAVDQTVSGTQTATMNANIYNGILNQKMTKDHQAFTIAQMATPTGLVSTIMNPFGAYESAEVARTQAQIANYEITHMEVPPHKIGSASPLLAWVQEFDARVIIYFPEGDVMNSNQPPDLIKAALEAFGRAKGFATCTPGTASNFHGFTQGTIIADNIPCTESERGRIREAFLSGVFLPWPQN